MRVKSHPLKRWSATCPCGGTQLEWLTLGEFFGPACSQHKLFFSPGSWLAAWDHSWNGFVGLVLPLGRASCLVSDL